MRLFLFLLISFLIFSCQKQDSLETYMVGSWETKTLDISMESPSGQDTTIQYTIDFEDEMDPRASIKARSEYFADGTFMAWYVDVDGSSSEKSPGTWTIDGNKLTVDYVTGGLRINPTYDLTRTENGFKAESTYDWDNDGQHDDFLIMTAKRMEKPQ